MKKRFWIAGGLALVAVIAIVLFLLLPSGGGQERTAAVVEAVNKVDAHPRLKDDWGPAAVGMTIYGGGQVRTGRASSARLELLEGIVRLSAESIFTVKESTSSQGRLVTTLFLQAGRLWAHVTTSQPHEFTIETGNAVAAVRDTRFSVKVADGETLLSVAEGEVELTAQEQSVTVTAGQQATVEPDQPPSPPEPMSDDERALWATEGEMPELVPPTPTAVPPTPLLVPPTLTPVPRVWGDVYCELRGPAGDLASRNPETVFDAVVRGGDAVQVVVKSPSGETVVLPPFGDVYGWERRFHKRVQGLPQARGTYAFTALDAQGTPIVGGVSSDVYIGGNEPAPPSDVQAEVVEAGILVTWDPSPVIPGAFDPSESPPLGFYQMSLSGEDRGTLYGWNSIGQPLPQTSHLIPFRRQDFGPGDRGQALEEMDDGIYDLSLSAFSVAPAGTAGRVNECSAHDPAEDIRIVIEGGQVRVEKP